MASSHLQPTSSQIPSKRDKRRNLLSDRLTELSVSFERDRDIHYRNQLAALQQDLSAIARADTSGRDLRLLDDSAEGIDNFVTGGAWVGDGAPMSNIRSSGGPGGAMAGVQPGTFYAGFVAEVNEKMEERDVALTLLHKQYHAKVAAIKAQHERSLHHAREEHINLAVTMKQRLINRLYNAKKKLSVDKEHLDISDNNALLLHPSQFSIGSAAAGVLGSPSRNDIDRNSDIFGSGGTINGSNGTSSGGRRKLRQRRNELDDLMMMGPGGIFDNFGRKDSDNGDTKSAAAQRRKARAARYNRRELLHKQVYSIEKLFTERELQMAGNLAALATVKYFSK
ncbi:Sds3-like-domain-containing protein, partial [Tirmania nivea]